MNVREALGKITDAQAATAAAVRKLTAEAVSTAAVLSDVGAALPAADKLASDVQRATALLAAARTCLVEARRLLGNN